MAALLTVAVLVVALLGIALLITALRFPADATSFSCRLRTAPVEGLESVPWPRGRARAVWAHDVLLIRHGRARVRLRVLTVRTPEEPLRVTRRGEVRGLGPEPLAVVLRLDDGSLVEVAARAHARTELVGPFFAAAIPGLRSGPQDRRNLGR